MDVSFQVQIQGPGTIVDLDGTLVLGSISNAASLVNTGAVFNILDGAVYDTRLATGGYTVAGMINEIDSGKILRNAGAVGLTKDDGATPERKIVLDNDIYALLFDKDENVDGLVPDTTTITMENLTQAVNDPPGDFETITLTEGVVDAGVQVPENANADGAFSGVVATADTDGIVPAYMQENGILEARVGDVIRIRYVDDEDNDDVVTALRTTTILDCNDNFNDPFPPGNICVGSCVCSGTTSESYSAT